MLFDFKLSHLREKGTVSLIVLLDCCGYGFGGSFANHWYRPYPILLRVQRWVTGRAKAYFLHSEKIRGYLVNFSANKLWKGRLVAMPFRLSTIVMVV